MRDHQHATDGRRAMTDQIDSAIRAGWVRDGLASLNWPVSESCALSLRHWPRERGCAEG